MSSSASPQDTNATDAIAFVGGGNMARSLIGGLVARGRDPASIQVAEPNESLRAALVADFGVIAHADNAEAVTTAHTWVFAVKPQVMKSVCQALAPIAQSRRPMILSIAAGITGEQLDRWLGGGLAVVRSMPNTPALLGAGATGLHANARVTKSQRHVAESLMQATGITEWIDDERLMHAVTALSGSGPAYVFLLAEAMQAAGEAQGLPPESARKLALQTILGAARMLTESGEPAAVLRQRVTSPNGTTQAALESFEAGGFRALVDQAVSAATRRGRELSAAND
ncbi:pyrroline-5-carboxylate reductase [Arenimonas sp.]|uniref:pyrroline-5-carboxylate reductase n=1 Tax=Arenimonas sp. TaxID=1872635 RepID=UPI0039E69C60